MVGRAFQKSETGLSSGCTRNRDRARVARTTHMGRSAMHMGRSAMHMGRKSATYDKAEEEHDAPGEEECDAHREEERDAR